MKPGVLLVGLAVAFAAGCASSSVNGQTSCVSPSLVPSPTVASPGGQIVVRGYWFVSDCADVRMSRGSSPASPAPLEAVNLIVKVGDSTAHAAIELGTVHPDSSGSFTAVVTLPRDLPAGQATLYVAGHGGPAQLTITAGIG